MSTAGTRKRCRMQGINGGVVFTFRRVAVEAMARFIYGEGRWAGGKKKKKKGATAAKRRLGSRTPRSEFDERRQLGGGLMGVFSCNNC